MLQLAVADRPGTTLLVFTATRGHAARVEDVARVKAVLFK
jgi:hypothetical protein